MNALTTSEVQTITINLILLLLITYGRIVLTRPTPLLTEFIAHIGS